MNAFSDADVTGGDDFLSEDEIDALMRGVVSELNISETSDKIEDLIRKGNDYTRDQIEELRVLRESSISLRDYFAANVMSGFCTNSDWAGTSFEVMAKQAYGMADAMLEERGK